MTRLITDRPGRNPDDYRRAMRDRLGRALEPASATTVHLATEPPSGGVLTLSRVHELLTQANATSPPDALAMRPLARVKATPEWFSAGLRDEVEAWLGTIAELIETGEVERSLAARQTLAFLVAAILDH